MRLRLVFGIIVVILLGMFVVAKYGFPQDTGTQYFNRLSVKSGLAPATGMQFKNLGSASCATAASVGATCTSSVTWPISIGDTNYFAVCSCIGAAGGVPSIGALTILNGGVTVTVIAETAAAASCSDLDCWEVHN